MLHARRLTNDAHQQRNEAGGPAQAGKCKRQVGICMARTLMHQLGKFSCMAGGMGAES